jgi:hypothetical protein
MLNMCSVNSDAVAIPRGLGQGGIWVPPINFVNIPQPLGLVKHKLNFFISLTAHFHDLHDPLFELSHLNSWGFDVKYSDRHWPTIRVRFPLFWYTLHTFTGMFYGIGSVGPFPLRKLMSLLRCSRVSIHIRAPPPRLSIWSYNNICLIQRLLIYWFWAGLFWGGNFCTVGNLFWEKWNILC